MPRDELLPTASTTPLGQYLLPHRMIKGFSSLWWLFWFMFSSCDQPKSLGAPQPCWRLCPRGGADNETIQGEWFHYQGGRTLSLTGRENGIANREGERYHYHWGRTVSLSGRENRFRSNILYIRYFFNRLSNVLLLFFVCPVLNKAI